MRLLRERVASPATILVVGGDGLVHELEKAGYTVTRSADDAPAAVVQGFAPHVGWQHLAEAAYALATPEDEGGIPWIATNTDWTIPQARGSPRETAHSFPPSTRPSVGWQSWRASPSAPSSTKPSRGSGRSIHSSSETA